MDDLDHKIDELRAEMRIARWAAAGAAMCDVRSLRCNDVSGRQIDGVMQSMEVSRTDDARRGAARDSRTYELRWGKCAPMRMPRWSNCEPK